jgi:hypothetical protein
MLGDVRPADSGSDIVTMGVTHGWLELSFDASLEVFIAAVDEADFAESVMEIDDSGSKMPFIE